MIVMNYIVVSWFNLEEYFGDTQKSEINGWKLLSVTEMCCYLIVNSYVQNVRTCLVSKC